MTTFELENNRSGGYNIIADYGDGEVYNIGHVSFSYGCCEWLIGLTDMNSAEEFKSIAALVETIYEQKEHANNPV